MKNLIAVLVISAAIFAGCNKDNTKNEQKQTANTSVSASNESIIRSKDVNVADIDVNKDNKVFQCPMDFDVISDKPGTCPKCKMELEEVSVADAQNNLK